MPTLLLFSYADFKALPLGDKVEFIWGSILVIVILYMLIKWVLFSDRVLGKKKPQPAATSTQATTQEQTPDTKEG